MWRISSGETFGGAGGHEFGPFFSIYCFRLSMPRTRTCNRSKSLTHIVASASSISANSGTAKVCSQGCANQGRRVPAPLTWRMTWWFEFTKLSFLPMIQPLLRDDAFLASVAEGRAAADDALRLW